MPSKSFNSTGSGAIKSRYELLLIPAKLVCSGRRKILKPAVGSKFARFLKQACQRLLE